MRENIKEFLEHAHATCFDFYNESTLQMELGMHLRKCFPMLQVTLERPVTSFGSREPGTKKEIDIAITDQPGNPYTAIEIKMLRSGRVPECMFDYCQDIRFCEALIGVGFPSAFALIYTPDKDFWQGRRTDEIYSYFRAGAAVSGRITKPTGGTR